MRKLLTIILIILPFILVMSNLCSGQTQTKIWQETTVDDFSKGTLNNIVIQNYPYVEGTLELRPQLVKTVDDYFSSGLPRFVAWDSTRSYYFKTWRKDSTLFLQKFSATGDTLSTRMRINDLPIRTRYHKRGSIALMPDGTILVAWFNERAEKNSWGICGQIIKDQSRIGNNFQINEKPLRSIDLPTILANKKDHTFWIFYQYKTQSEMLKIYVHQFSTQGEKLRIFRLNPENDINFNMVSSVAQSTNGNIIVTWIGGHDSIITSQNIYARQYSYNGEPIGPIFKVNDDIGQKGQFHPYICFDDSSNFLIAWADERRSIVKDTTWYYRFVDIYGQFYSKNCEKIDYNFRINNTSLIDNRLPQIEFIDERFRISWLTYLTNYYGPYANIWEFRTIYSGNFISSPFDTGEKGTKYSTIMWTANTPDGSNISLQLRSGSTLQELSQSKWYGPTDANTFYVNNKGETINTIHNDDRFIQYRAYFSRDRITINPRLYSISILYIPSDSTPPSTPKNFSAIPEHARIILTWDANTEVDLKSYKLYRGEDSGRYNPSWTKVMSPGQTTFIDTSAISGKTYFYVISAVDSSNNESPLSPEVSATAYGIKIYVDDDNTIGGDGTKENPYSSIGKAIMEAFYGDTIFVLPGTYEETIDMKKGVSLIGSGARQTQIIGSGEKYYIIRASDNACVKNFMIIREYSSIRNAIFIPKVSPTIQNNIIANYNENGTNRHAISALSSFPTIINNYIWGFDIGIFAHISEAVPSKPLNICNNIIKALDEGIYAISHPNAHIINNTIFVKRQWCIHSSNNRFVEIKNNILYGLDPKEVIGITDRGSNLNIDYNDIWNTKQKYQRISPSNNDISADPLFINFARDDFRLQDNSPCKNGGDPNASFNDLDGSRNDIGAYGGPTPINTNLTDILTRSIAIQRLSAFAGDTISTYIIMDNPAGLAKAEMEIEFTPSLLTFLNAKLTKTTQDFVLYTTFKNPNMLQITLSSNNEIISGDGKILQLDFIISSNAQADDSASVLFKTISLFDSKGYEIRLMKIMNGVFIIGTSGAQEGRYIFVDSHYEGEEEGTRLKPFRHIQTAIDQAIPGDTVFVAGGDYYEQIKMKEGIYLKGAGASITTIHVKLDRYIFVESIYFSNIKNGGISGFTFKQKGFGFGLPVIRCYKSSPWIVKNRFQLEGIQASAIECSIHSNAIIINNVFIKGGITVGNSSPIILSNRFLHISEFSIYCKKSPQLLIAKNKIDGDDYNTGIYFSQSSGLITRNWIKCGKRQDNGIVIENSSNVKVTNNIIDGHNESATGIFISSSSKTSIINNTIDDIGKGIEESSSDVTIMNNIVSNNKGFGLRCSFNSVINYNDVWNNNVDYSQCTPGENDISADPQFIDLQNGDYHLMSSSPCIDAGNPSVIYNDPDGTRNDIGCYGGPGSDSDFNHAGIKIFLPSTMSSNSDTVNIRIAGTQIKNISRIDIELSYDYSLLKLLQIKTTENTKLFSLKYSKIDSGTIQLTMQSSFGIFLESGDFLELSFRAKREPQLDGFIKIEQAAFQDRLGNTSPVSAIYDGPVKIILTKIKDTFLVTVPDHFNIYPNYPNPFNSKTMIKYDLANNCYVTIKIYDILGREIRTLVSGRKNAGVYTVKWQGTDNAGKMLPSGIYLCKFKTESFTRTIKMLLVR